jgi:hypothetical protein
MRPVPGVALALAALAGCFSDTAPQLTGASDGTASTSSSTSGSTSSSTSTTSTSTTGPEPTGTTSSTSGTCPEGQLDRPWYGDLDGDGHGAGDPLVTACVGPEGAVDVAGDCDDTDPAVHPGADELCNMLVDDDCDGLRDEYSPKNTTCEPCSLTATATATYWACTAPLDYLAAEAACQGFGATVHLVNPADAEELALVAGLAQQRYPAPPTFIDFWVGIRRPMDVWDSCTIDPAPATWEGHDGSPVTHLPWTAGEPNNNECSEFCMAAMLADPLCKRENCVELASPAPDYNDSFCGTVQTGHVCKAPL